MECEDGVCELPMTREDKVADYLWASDGLREGTNIKQADLMTWAKYVAALRETFTALCDLSLMLGTMNHAGKEADTADYQRLIYEMAMLQYTLSKMAVIMGVNLEEAFNRVHEAELAAVPPDKEYVAPDLSDLLS